jgi:hypothetical protein
VDLTGAQCGDVVGRDERHEVDRLPTAHDELAHVRDVEQAAALADRFVLGRDPGRVLDGHVKTRKRNHFSAECDVHVVERRAVERAGAGLGLGAAGHRGHAGRGLDREYARGSEWILGGGNGTANCELRTEPSCELRIAS